MKVVLLAGLAILAVVSASFFYQSMKPTIRPVSSQLIAKYTAWKKQFGKLYATPAEDHFRLREFGVQDEYVNTISKEYEQYASSKGQKLSGPMFELNKFADLSDEEFKARYTKRRPLKAEYEVTEPEEVVSEIQATNPQPKNGLAQTPYQIIVRDQGACGSCWAFSAIATFEKFYYDKTAQRLSFSQQQLVDCDTLNAGCDGGHEGEAMQYILKNGLNTLENYPYKGSQLYCRADKTKNLKVAFTTSMTAFSVSSTVAALKAGHHVATSLVGSKKFRYLSSTDDVYDASATGECKIYADHAINVVASDGTGAYLTVLNSWGTSWGVRGTKKIKPCNANNYWGLQTETIFLR